MTYGLPRSRLFTLMTDWMLPQDLRTPKPARLIWSGLRDWLGRFGLPGLSTRQSDRFEARGRHAQVGSLLRGCHGKCHTKS